MAAPAPKRARRTAGLLLDDMEDADSESSRSGSGSDAEPDDPLDALLRAALGYPLPEDARAWTPSGLKLRHWTRPQYEGGETVVGGVYWVQAPDGRDGAPWAAEQPWMDNLTCRPHKNSLAPGAPKAFSVAYRHPTRKDWIGVPRFWGMALFGAPSRDVRSVGERMSEAVALRPGRPLRDYQLRARAAALANLEHWGGATIIADCGAGKVRASPLQSRHLRMAACPAHSHHCPPPARGPRPYVLADGHGSVHCCGSRAQDAGAV